MFIPLVGLPDTIPERTALIEGENCTSFRELARTRCGISRRTQWGTVLKQGIGSLFFSPIAGATSSWCTRALGWE